MTEPTNPRAVSGSNSLPDLARQIVEAHEAVESGPKNAASAMRCGKFLIEAKDHAGQYGKWGTYLKEQCKGMTARTAQRYMDLARNEAKLEALCRKMTADGKATHVSHLSFREAMAMIKPPSDPKLKKPDVEYEAAEEKLIEKLEALQPAAIDGAVKKTIRHLRNSADHLLAAKDQKVA